MFIQNDLLWPQVGLLLVLWPQNQQGKSNKAEVTIQAKFLKKVKKLFIWPKTFETELKGSVVGGLSDSKTCFWNWVLQSIHIILERDCESWKSLKCTFYIHEIVSFVTALFF